jgi:hypothetical protein
MVYHSKSDIGRRGGGESYPFDSVSLGFGLAGSGPDYNHDYDYDYDHDPNATIRDSSKRTDIYVDGWIYERTNERPPLKPLPPDRVVRITVTWEAIEHAGP